MSDETLGNGLLRGEQGGGTVPLFSMFVSPMTFPHILIA